jgi:uncharacterized protein YecT (DUF1311 family)
MRLLLLPLLILLHAGAAVAQDEQPDCDNPVTQMEMNFCEAEAYRAADEELDKVWEEARGAAEALDAELSENLRGALDALVAAQRAWLQYRDNACKLAGFEARGGSMEPLLISGCLREMTEERTQELRDFIAGPEG